MNEPSNHVDQVVWPEWHQQPLRLTNQEISNPYLVIDEFFQCYHLPDIRECLTNWLQDALAKETIESKKHITTHDWVQKLVEAIWSITHIRSAKEGKLIGSDENKKDSYSKPQRLVERAPENPMEVLTEAFTHISIMDLRDDLLPNWLRTAIISDMGTYDYVEDRAKLYEFNDQLNLLIEALYIVVDMQGLVTSDKNALQQLVDNLPKHNQPTLLSKEQRTDPMGVVNHFFRQFDIDYIRRELWDFLDAAVGFDGTYPKGFSAWLAFYTYNYVICLTEGGYHLYKTVSGRRKQ